MKIVITGANGFLGSWLVRSLQKENAELFALVRPTSDLSDLEGLSIQSLHGDVTDLTSLNAAFEGADSVFHLAGVVAYNKAQRSLMQKVNVEGTRNVIRACREAKVRRLVHLSSVTAVGAGFSPDEILNENSPFNLAQYEFGYFDTKKAAEDLVREAVWAGELDAVILNPSTIYGAGDAKKGSRRMQLKVARGELAYYPKGGVSVIGVEDTVDGIIAAWKKGRSGERYILSGQNLFIHELFRFIAEAAGERPPQIALPNWVVHTAGAWGDLRQSLGLSSSLSLENARVSTLYHWFDNSKARRELGLIPRPAKDAIAASVGWMREKGLLKK